MVKVTRRGERETVLVAVLPRPRDLAILRRAHWYRIPLAFMPKRRFRYLAFYEPAAFGRAGKCIRYYARVVRRRIVPRIRLLPRETRHPRAHARYAQLFVKDLTALPHPIRNTVPRRVSFGFTTLPALRASRNLLELYWVPPTEEIVARHLAHLDIRATREVPVVVGGKRFRLDFAIVANGHHVAIECDNEKAHAGKAQRRKDKAKDATLRRAGWRVIRLRERDIIEHPDACMKRIQRALPISSFVRMS